MLPQRPSSLTLLPQPYPRQPKLCSRLSIIVLNAVSVTPFVLQVGGQDVASLQGTCQAIAEDVAGALTAMAGSAGHQGLSAALTKAAGQGNRTFTLSRSLREKILGTGQGSTRRYVFFGRSKRN
jgi:hypothetical protein